MFYLILLLTIPAYNAYDPSDAFGFFEPDLGYGQSCQFFKNGQFYQGPCKDKDVFNQPKYDFGESDLYGSSSESYLTRPYKKPSIKAGGIRYPGSSGYNGGNSGYGYGEETIKPDYGISKPEYGKPEIGYGKPGTSYGKPQGGYGKPETGYGKPEIGYGKPETGYGKPETGYGKPEGGYGKPEGGYGKPETGYGKPEGGYGKPETGYGRPNTGYGKPVKGHGKPEVGFVKTFVKKCQTNDGLEGICQPVFACYHQFEDLGDISKNFCENNNKLPYVCCPIQYHREPKVGKIPIRIPKILQFKAELPRISLKDIEVAARQSAAIVKSNLNLELELVRKGLIQTPNSMEAYHQAFFGGPDPLSRQIAKDGFIILETTIQLAKRFQLEKTQARDGLKQFTLLETSLVEHCPKEPVCKKLDGKYRTADGSCNNLANPLWGMSHTSFIRLAPPDYADGLNQLRRASDGSHLPSPRIVSTALATDVDIPDVKFTLMVMQWGQFMDHDLTLTASRRIDSDRGEGIVCCREEFARNPGIRHPDCKPITINHDDPFYSQHDHHCNNFVRNAPSPTPECNLGPREQSNTLTHYLDGSMVYGSTAERAAFLRSYVKGKLRNSKVNGVEYLPFDTQNRSDECAIPSRSRLQCFVGGDVRVNEQTGLTILHMLWLREHNRVADKLSALNPTWPDEIIYQEARRIVAAVIQHINYNEWMPLILGRRVMKDFNLFPKPSGYTFDYDPNLNGGIINSFATAAYRFHNLIQGVFKLMSNSGKITNKLQLRNLFNNPETVYPPGAYDQYLNCLTAQPTQAFDQFFTQELTNHLFQEHERPFGMDLISLNIQRGRDHGLPGYNVYRKVCGLHPIRSFGELDQVMRKGSAERMSKIYKSVDDIDLFIAGNHEKALPGAAVGPTFACILAEQARRSKQGDRFWYENGDMLHSFNEEQLHEIRKSSLASIICANSDNIQFMQPLGFLQPSELNKKIPCKDIPQLNLALWKNEPLHKRF